MSKNIEDLERDNPNIRQQNDEWRKLRAERGEDPNDEAALREHLTRIGAPDPGEGKVADPHGAASREAGGVKDQLVGNLKEGTGKVLGNEQMEAEGDAQSRRGETSRRAD